MQWSGIIGSSEFTAASGRCDFAFLDQMATALSNMRLKLSARGRRLRWNAQWKSSILSAAPAGRSLSAIR
jgi:hypothetical protein